MLLNQGQRWFFANFCQVLIFNETITVILEYSNDSYAVEAVQGTSPRQGSSVLFTCISRVRRIVPSTRLKLTQYFLDQCSPQFICQLQIYCALFLSECLWVRYLTSLCIPFFIIRVAIMVVPISQGYGGELLCYTCMHSCIRILCCRQEVLKVLNIYSSLLNSLGFSLRCPRRKHNAWSFYHYCTLGDCRAKALGGIDGQRVARVTVLWRHLSSLSSLGLSLFFSHDSCCQLPWL